MKTKGGLMNRINKNNQSADNQIAKEINLKELIAVIKKRFWIAAIVTVLFTLNFWNL